MHVAHLIRVAEVFASARGISLARVATLVRNDGKFFARLARGATCTLRTYDDTLQWFADHWPDGAVWPADVPRPRKAHAVAAPSGRPANNTRAQTARNLQEDAR